MPSDNFTDSVIYIEASDINGDAVSGMAPLGIVMLQSKGCGHCTAAKPEYQKLADRLQNVQGVQAYTVQADTDSQAMKAMSQMIPGFRGFPTYALFRDGRYLATYDGPRTADAIMTFIEQGGETRSQVNLPPKSRRVRFQE